MPSEEVTEIPESVLGRLLLESGDAVLVGGQALAFWVAYYDIEPSGRGAAPRACITGDVDFLGAREDTERLARAVDGVANHPRGMTILAGVVSARTTAGKRFEVDVLRVVNGLSGDVIRKNAKRVTSKDGGAVYRVMAPIDCLVSRVENLRTIRAKQDEIGQWQARLAVMIVRHNIEEMLAEGREVEAIGIATRVLRAATHAMGINAYLKYGIDILEAVPIGRFSKAAFIEQQWRRSVDRILKGRDPKKAVARRGDARPRAAMPGATRKPK